MKNNLMGISRKMQDKNWTDSQGRKGKVKLVLQSSLLHVDRQYHSAN